MPDTKTVAVPILLARDIARYLSFFGTTRALELADALDKAIQGDL